MKRGIDVSKYQGKIDFEKVKADGIDFVVIREGYGRHAYQKDSFFERNYHEAKKAGLKIGFYHFSYAADCEDAVLEARAFLENIRGKSYDLPCFFDIEGEALSKGDALGKCEAFCKVLKENGVAYGVYASESEFKTRLRGLSADIPCWIAHYGVKRQELPCYMWQSSSEGKIDGVSGRCDTDVLYGEYIPYQNHCEKPTTELSSETKYKLGQRVRFSTCYKSSTDDISKAIYAKNMLKDNGVITKIYAGRKNPYLLDGDLCFVNDGDIREVLSSPSLAKDSLRNTQFYVVQRGDNLTKIARLFGVRVKELVRLNDIKNPDLIFPGQRLKIR